MSSGRPPLPRNLAKAFKAARAELQRELEPHGVHAGQDYLLEVLWEEDGLTVGTIAQRLGIEVPTVVRTVHTGLEDKVVLVTGGSAGIGRAVARAYAREGARLAVTYRSNREAGEEAAAVAGDGLAVHMDLEQPESIRSAVEAVVDRFGGIDVLVVSAVRWPRAGGARFEDLPEDEWRGVLRANLEGAFATVRAALPAMRDRLWGRVVLISSGIAEEGHPVTWPYAAAKAGLHGFARTLAWDLGRDGILVNVVGTGFTATEHNRERFPDEMRERVAALVPQKRVSEPEDVASLVLFLGSAANSSVTGEVVREGTSAARTPLVAVA